MLDPVTVRLERAAVRPVLLMSDTLPAPALMVRARAVVGELMAPVTETWSEAPPAVAMVELAERLRGPVISIEPAPVEVSAPPRVVSPVMDWAPVVLAPISDTVAAFMVIEASGLTPPTKPATLTA